MCHRIEDEQQRHITSATADEMDLEMRRDKTLTAQASHATSMTSALPNEIETNRARLAGLANIGAQWRHGKRRVSIFFVRRSRKAPPPAAKGRADG